MSDIFQEEQEALLDLEQQLDIAILQWQEEIAKLQAILDEKIKIEADDGTIPFLKDCIRKEKEELAQFVSYKNSPYFGRIELDRETEQGRKNVVYCIGENAIYRNSDNYVLDWRSPIGDCYYAQNQTRFFIKGQEAILLMKRGVEIENGALIACEDLYDARTSQFDGELMDPFLKRVIQAKRRVGGITDIIRTIQANQNAIIRSPQEESFVVQGCAGSGKTMVLLHRLSYLKFNNSKFNWGNVKIITPNKHFANHIRDLSQQLEIGSIGRFSVEEYYVRLMQGYQPGVKIKTDVISEKVLSEALMTTLYSQEYMEELCGLYQKFWEDTLATLQEERLMALFQQYDFTYPNTSIYKSATFSSLSVGIQKLFAAIGEAKRKRTACEEDIALVQARITEMQQQMEAAQPPIAKAKKSAASRIEQRLQEIRNAVSEEEDNHTWLLEVQQGCNEQIAKLRADIELLKQSAALLYKKRDVYSSYDSVLTLDDETSILIREQFAQEISEIDELGRALGTVPTFNFAKRAAKKKELEEEKRKLATAISAFIDQYLEDGKGKRDDLMRQIHTEEDGLKGFVLFLKESKDKLQRLRQEMQLLEEFAVLLESEEPFTIDQIRNLSKLGEKVGDALRLFEKERDVFRQAAKQMASLKTTLQARQEEYETLSSLDAQDILDYLTLCRDTIRQLDFENIIKVVLANSVKMKYKEYKEKFRKTNYRHKLYLRLLFCWLYFSHSASNDTFLNIDEAQDISIAEYKLLRSILGENCVFNLYGDVNQVVYSYKGITDWEELTDIVDGRVYVLNENYRNTLQITKFCNQEFGAEILPIGIEGDEVQEMTALDALDWILEQKRKNPTWRTAVLYRHGLKAVHTLLMEKIPEQSASWHHIEDDKVAVCSVEEAKGLEFEAVVVFVDQMTLSEQYISYTRPLSNLVVVRDEFSTELLTDDGEEVSAESEEENGSPITKET